MILTHVMIQIVLQHQVNIYNLNKYNIKLIFASLSIHYIIVYKMNLSPEQQLALDEFSMGKNIFLTGPGGSGKTELIKRMVLASEASHKKFQVCALTGCAAVLLNCKAKTIHSWAGIGLANGSIEEVVRKVIGNKYKIAPWIKIDILIIDEVSMMSLKLFEILDLLGKKIRKSYKNHQTITHLVI